MELGLLSVVINSDI